MVEMDTTDRIWAFITRHMREHGYAPSYKEIITGASISSLSVVDYHLKKLAERGIIIKGPPGTARTFRVVKEWSSDGFNKAV